MQYLILLSDLLHALQDQETIFVPIMFFWGENYLVYIHIITKILENLIAITL